jgi:hypothetical protein
VATDAKSYEILSRIITQAAPREGDGLEGLPCIRKIGNARRPAPGLCGRVGGKAQAGASNVAVLIEFESRDYLNAFEELLALR